ncbi:LysR family transcriptional regulator [Bacillus sp. AFS002410]|uniref:LysR family transcriptional regulator n=1 Tax=Bacillus sp. AFS002410 TaxID=2033481 RepID=UPI000BF0725D|nr:LysR family transcriptional regulator [Bacillus sp. AFS002410]PEJ49332.1 LysR family transcriptional regulator [Bacillus sp. AFS002410]
MELLQLKYFQTVAKLEHITKAAEVLQIAQPSLSKTITRLENDLGVPLFDRHNRQIKLNHFGKLFLQRVNKALMELEEGQREVQELAGLKKGSITLASSISKILPELMSGFMSEYPDVHFKQVIKPISEMKNQLLNGVIDLCISSLPIENEEIEWIPLIKEDIFLIIPSGHHLSNRKSIDLIELKDETFISLNAGFGFRDFTDQFCIDAGFIPNVSFEVDEPFAIIRFVNQGLGVAFMPVLDWTTVTENLPERIRINDATCQLTIGLGWSKNRYISLAAQDFKKFVIEYFEKISYR